MTLPRTPLEAFDARILLALWWDSQNAETLRGLMNRQRGALLAGSDVPGPRSVDPETVEAVRVKLAGGWAEFPDTEMCRTYLKECDLIWVDRDMSELTRVAALSFPSENPLTRAEVPALSGLVMFQSELKTVEMTSFCAIQWLFERDRGRLILVPYLTADAWAVEAWPEREGQDAAIRNLRALGPVLPLGRGICPVGDSSTEPEFAVLRAFWAIARQRLSVTRRVTVDRGGRRRAERANIDLPEVQVVTLRRAALTGNRSPEPSGEAVDWTHRWIVGGHWRNHWYPSTRSHNPIWIAPYVKGPENKPLVADRMYQLTR